MRAQPFPVPEWCSWENQGVAITLADLTANGRPDLVVFLVDRLPGHNQGLYRVGHDVADDGAVTGGWEPWRRVPDWLSASNQGAAVTVTDVTGSGRPDLVIFTVHAGPGTSQGLYRVGRDLDARGEPSSGWGPWRAVPPWHAGDAPATPVTPAGHPRARDRASRLVRALGTCLLDGLQVYGAVMLNPGYAIMRSSGSAHGSRPRFTWVDARSPERDQRSQAPGG